MKYMQYDTVENKYTCMYNAPGQLRSHRMLLGVPREYLYVFILIALACVLTINSRCSSLDKLEINTQTLCFLFV